MARNISYIHDYFDIRSYDVYREMANQQIDDLSMSLMNRLFNNSRGIREIASEFDADTHLPFGSGVTLFYHLLAKKIMVTDMYKPIDLEQPIFSSVNERNNNVKKRLPLFLVIIGHILLEIHCINLT